MLMGIVSPEMDRLDVECSRRCDSYSGARSKIAARAPFHGRMIASLFGRPPRNFIFIADADKYFEILLGARIIFSPRPAAPSAAPCKSLVQSGSSRGPSRHPATPPARHSALLPSPARPCQSNENKQWRELGGAGRAHTFPTKFPH